MRTFRFDQFEFDSFSSEETLEIAIASKHTRQFAGIASFAAAALGQTVALPAPGAFNESIGFGTIRAYLRRFAGIEIPADGECLSWTLFVDDLEWDGLLETPDSFIRYHWWSTA